MIFYLKFCFCRHAPLDWWLYHFRFRPFTSVFNCHIRELSTAWPLSERERQKEALCTVIVILCVEPLALGWRLNALSYRTVDYRTRVPVFTNHTKFGISMWLSHDYIPKKKSWLFFAVAVSSDAELVCYWWISLNLWLQHQFICHDVWRVNCTYMYLW